MPDTATEWGMTLATDITPRVPVKCRCGRKVAEATENLAGRVFITCPRCGTIVTVGKTQIQK